MRRLLWIISVGLIAACGGGQADADPTTTLLSTTTTTDATTTTTEPTTTTTTQATTTTESAADRCQAGIDESLGTLETFFDRFDSDPAAMLEDSTSDAALEIFGGLGTLIGTECASAPGDGVSGLIVFLASEANTRSELTVVVIDVLLEGLCTDMDFPLTLQAQAACVTFE